MANPANPWAWAGLAGDIVDVAVPFVGGVGEAIKCCGGVKKADNVNEAFMREYLWQHRGKKVLSEDEDAWTYNQIWSPGRKYTGWI